MNTTKKTLLFLLASIPIALIGYFVKMATLTANVYTVSFYRLLTATITLALILPYIDKNTYKPAREHLPHYALIGALIAVTFTLFNIANTLAPLSNVYLLNSIAPALIIILSVLFLKEKITKKKIIALTLTLIGLTIMNPLQSASVKGNTIALITGVSYAIMYTRMKYENVKQGAGNTFWYFLFATLYSTPLLTFGHEGIIQALPWILALGIISTALAYTALTLLLETENAGTTSIAQTIIIPLTAILIGAFILQEPLRLSILLGGSILILAGTIIKMPSYCKH